MIRKLGTEFMSTAVEAGWRPPTDAFIRSSACVQLSADTMIAATTRVYQQHSLFSAATRFFTDVSMEYAQIRSARVTEDLGNGSAFSVLMTEMEVHVGRSMRFNELPYKVRVCVAESPDDRSATIVTSRGKCGCKAANSRCKHNNCAVYAYYAIQSSKFGVGDFTFGARRSTKLMFEEVEQSNAFHFAPSEASASILLRLRRTLAPMPAIMGSALSVQM